MRHAYGALVLLVLSVGSCQASLTINAELIKKATVFIYTSTQGGDPSADKADGTGFLVAVPFVGKPGGYILLLTARISLTRRGQAINAGLTRLGFSLCAGHVQPLGGASPLPDLMEVRVSNDARATVVRRGLKEAWSKCASRWTKTGYKA